MNGAPSTSAPKHFRKGTKSCIECRQRKLRCIPSSAEGQPCRNCADKGRHCILQVHAGRGAEVGSSRDRIRRLEDSVGKLSRTVKSLQARLGGHDAADAAQQEDSDVKLDDEDDDAQRSDSSLSDALTLPWPAPLQQLFHSEAGDFASSHSHSPSHAGDKALAGAMLRASARLRPLIPPKHDFLPLVPAIAFWLDAYRQAFGPLGLFRTAAELDHIYDVAIQPDADALSIAGLLLSIVIGLQNGPLIGLPRDSALVQDPTTFTTQVCDTVEEVIIDNDLIAGTFLGIEMSLFWIRPQLPRANSKKLWLVLRRCIALAELAGLPHAQDGAEAALWDTVCSMDRFVGTVFNLPLGTAGYGVPPPQNVMSSDGRVVMRAYMINLTRVASAIRDIDDAYMIRKSEQELREKVERTDADLQALRAMIPESMWTARVVPDMPDAMLQIFHNYLRIRTHLQLALRNSTDAECRRSCTICIHAGMELADRYEMLRSNRPPAFFIARIVDLEAMTAAFVLIYSAYRSSKGLRESGGQDDVGGEAARQAAYKIVRMMESVSRRAAEQHQLGTDVARKAAKAIRSLDTLLNQPESVESHTLSLWIPTLGRLNVSRQAEPLQSHPEQLPLSEGSGSAQADVPPLNEQALGVMDDMTWDLLLGDFGAAGDFSGQEQWFTFSND